MSKLDSSQVTATHLNGGSVYEKTRAGQPSTPPPHTTCPSCGDTLIPEQTSRLGTCLGTGACIRIEKFRRHERTAVISNWPPPWFASIHPDPDTVGHLADLIHDNQCDRHQPCGYGLPHNPHHAYYRDRARSLHEKLEPEIGAANVVLAVRVILDELW